MSQVKDEAKRIVLDIFGPINAEKIDKMDDSNPIDFLNKVKDIIAATLGPKIAEQTLVKLYAKYK